MQVACIELKGGTDKEFHLSSINALVQARLYAKLGCLTLSRSCAEYSMDLMQQSDILYGPQEPI
jgi:hypothetical protein